VKGQAVKVQDELQMAEHPRVVEMRDQVLHSQESVGVPLLEQLTYFQILSQIQITESSRITVSYDKSLCCYPMMTCSQTQMKTNTGVFPEKFHLLVGPSEYPVPFRMVMYDDG
jgi:hypothetical protein